MIIKVGTLNPVKCEAVWDIAYEYPEVFSNDGKGFHIEAVDVPSGVGEQPLSLTETYKGAHNRALAAFKDCDLSIGIESGLMDVPDPYTSMGFVNFTAVVIYDGKNIYAGQSTGFDIPPSVVNGLNTSEDMDKIVHSLGYTDDPNIGEHGGYLGILTKGRVTRKEYTKQAIRMAMIPLENKELYGYV